MDAPWDWPERPCRGLGDLYVYQRRTARKIRRYEVFAKRMAKPVSVCRRCEHIDECRMWAEESHEVQTNVSGLLTVVWGARMYGGLSMFSPTLIEALADQEVPWSAVNLRTGEIEATSEDPSRIMASID
jgi:hypothetical protein